MAWLLDTNVLSELRRLRSQRDEVRRHSAQVVFLYYLAYH
jgi:predicted nucleic acid-binding protein